MLRPNTGTLSATFRPLRQLVAGQFTKADAIELPLYAGLVPVVLDRWDVPRRYAGLP